MGDIRKRPGF